MRSALTHFLIAAGLLCAIGLVLAVTINRINVSALCSVASVTAGDDLYSRSEVVARRSFMERR